MAGLREWQLSAAEQQQTLYNQFGDRLWDSIRRDDTATLNTKIAFTLFATSFETCNTEQRNSINETRKKLLELCGSGNVFFGCVFVSVLPKDTNEHCIVPLIRTKQTYGDDLFFFEQQPGRVYKSWTDYLENHKLPSGNICYPVEGIYRTLFNQRVNIAFRESSGRSVVGVVFDVASSVAKTASTGLILAALFFPMATPFVVGAAAVLGTSTAYSATRTVLELTDRGSHHESINLTNPRARELWIGMGMDIIGSVLVGGAAVLPRLVASGRLASSMASTVMDVLNWVSIGVNSFGVLTNVAVLIGKLRSGTLELGDFAFFISSCLFIGNIVVNAAIAERVIQSLSNRPSQLSNIFKMVTIGSFSQIKTISIAITWEKVIETICGDTVITFMRYAGMNHFAEFLKSIKGLLKRFSRGVVVSIWSVLVDLQRILRNHLMEVLDEVAEAWKKTRTFFTSNNLPLNVFTQPSLEAAEIVNNAERVLDEANIHDKEMRESLRDSIMAAALQMARDLNAKTEREFSNLAQLAMNDIRCKFDRRMVVQGSERSHMLPEDRIAVLQEAIHEFRTKFEANAESLEGQENTMQNSNLNLIPLTMSDDFDGYVFQVPYRLPEFDQFIYDAACHLLRDDDFLDYCRLEIGDGIVFIQSRGNTLIFYCEQLKDSDSAIGMVLIKN